MTAQEILKLIQLADGIIDTAMRHWSNFRNAPATDSPEVAAELDARYADYTDRIQRAKARSYTPPPGDERDPVG
jgi:hypothetical protein